VTTVAPEMGAPLTRRQRSALVAVVALAVALRVAWCAAYAREAPGLADPGFYRLLAVQLADFDGYVLEGRPTAYYPVGYPAVLGAVFWAGGAVGLESSRALTGMVVAVNLVAGVAGVGFAFLLARRTAGATAGIAAAAVVAAMPNLVFHSAVALSETLFIALVLAFALVLAGAPWESTGPGRRRLLVAGALLGAAALVRPVALPVLPLLVLVWRSASLPTRRAIRDIAAVAVAAVVVILPWTIRNAVRMDAFVPISTNTGDNLCMSRQPDAHGGFLLTAHCFGGPEIEALVRPGYETRRDARARRLAFEFVREHPSREVRLWLDRLGASFRHDHDALDAVEGYGEGAFLSRGERDVYRRLADGAWYVVGVAGAAATVAVVALRRLRRDPRAVLLVVTAVGLLLPIVLFFGDPRFKVPAVPFLALLVVCVPAALRRPAPPP
jgi:4-amino-4-deoxy-L-arabinose transferase-like glycosyltransferase